MTNVSISGDIVRFYPYRTARVAPWNCRVQLQEEDFRYLRKKLQRSGYEMDNHIVFCTETCAFWYSDNYLYIGGEIKEGEY